MSLELIEGSAGEHLDKSKTQTASQVELSVVVPAYREGPAIYGNLTRLVTELDKLKVTYEIIVVSDGNTDTTVSEARRVPSKAVRVFSYPMNIGKGFALSCGVDQSTGSMVTFIDADMELDPATIGRFIQIMNADGCDAVVGSKRHPQSEVAYPTFRRFQSAVYQILIRTLFNLNIRDTQTGLKLFRRQVLSESLPLLAIKRFAFDLELLVVARQLGYRNVCEAPVKLDYRFESTVNLGSAWNVLWDTAAIFYRLRILRFYQRRRLQLLEAEHQSQSGSGATAEV
jgi:glycosyltransferase involved in cell wall biosynthesis